MAISTRVVPERIEMRLAEIASLAKQTLKKISYTTLALLVGMSSLAVASPLVFSGNALAATPDVCSSGCTYSSIQDAINAAGAGDTITVGAGTYTENVVVNKAVTLTGAGASSTKIVATDANSSPLTFSTNGATVNGFTLTHSYTSAELAAWNFNNNGVTFSQLADGNTLENSTVSLSRNGIYLNNNENNVITGNTITNNRTGINMVNDLAGTTITHNTISDNWTEGLVTYGSSIPVNYSLVTVSSNTFDNNWYEEVTVKDASASSGTLDVSGNTFTDSPVTYSTSDDSSLNEPGFAAQQPTSLGGTATEPTSALPTLRIYDSGSVALKYDSTKTIYVASGQAIQDAVNIAASGDTVSVAAGTYDGFSVSNKTNITISGAGAGSTIISPTTLVDSSTTHKYTSDMKVSLFVNNSTGVTLQGLTIKDNGSAPGAGGPDALVFWNASSGTIQNSNITGTYTINGIQTGQGIAMDASGAQNASLTVSGTTISGFQKNGIDVINGNGSTSGATGTVNLTVSGSTITGAGSTGTIAQNGIVLWDRAGSTVSGTVSGSSISGFKYTPLDISNGNNGTGILTYGAGASVSVSNSTLENSDLEAANATTSGTFSATNNYWGASPNFTSIIGQASDGYGTVTYSPYYLDAGKTTLSNQSALTSLSLSSGTLSPSFSSGTTSYSATVANSVTAVTPSYTASAGANVSVSGGSNLAVGNNTLSLSVTSADGTSSSTYTVTLNRAAATQTLPSSDGSATLNSSTPQVVVTSASQPVTITVSSGTSNASIDYSSLKTSATTAIVPQTTINTQDANVQIQSNTTITASSSSWDGVVNAPTVQTAASVSIPTPAGQSTVVGTVIDVGADNGISLTFDKAVRLLMPGQAGQLVGFVRSGNFTQITDVCSADSQDAGNALPAGGNCYINAGNDMAVWTKHFTQFVTYVNSNTYTVQPGDTMFSIATKLGLTLARLESLNPGAGHPAGNFSFILPGDVLKIGGAVVPASAQLNGTGNSASNSEVLGQSTNTPNSATSSASVTKPAIATTSAAKSKSGKILGIEWYIWLIAVAALAAATYSANYVRNGGTTAKKK